MNSKQWRRQLLDQRQRDLALRRRHIENLEQTFGLELAPELLEQAKAEGLYIAIETLVRQADARPTADSSALADGGPLQPVYFNPSSVQYEPYLRQESAIILCAAHLKDGEQFNYLRIQFLPLDLEFVSTASVLSLIPAGRICRIEASPFTLPLPLRRLCESLAPPDRGPGDTATAQHRGIEYLLQDEYHSRSPFFFQCGDIRGCDLDPASGQAYRSSDKVNEISWNVPCVIARFPSPE
jgi:hypothetical protein